MALKEISRSRIAAARLRRMAADLILEAEVLEAEDTVNQGPRPNAKLLIASFWDDQKPKRKKP
jgi:hypothetical protein